MEELLKELGYTDEQIKAILDGMKNKKIYTSGEENADVRLGKLQDDLTGRDDELTKANELIKQLQEGNKDLQTKDTEYETQITKMKEEQHIKDVDNALKLELLKNKAKADDIDYLIFKIKAKQGTEKDFELDENGNLKDFKMDDIKKEFKGNFEDESGSFVDVKKLGGTDKKIDIRTRESNTLLDALKEKYTPNEDL